MAKLASEGKLRALPRLSEKSEQKILKSIENYRQLTGRFLLNTADEIAAKMTDFLAGLPGVEKVTPAGLAAPGERNRGRSGLLVTGRCCNTDAQRNAVIERIVSFPGSLKCWPRARIKLASSCATACRWMCACSHRILLAQRCNTLPAPKTINVQLRQRAIKQGYTLNEYGLVRVEDNKRVAGKTEEEIYKKLGLKFLSTGAA